MRAWRAMHSQLCAVCAVSGGRVRAGREGGLMRDGAGDLGGSTGPVKTRGDLTRYIFATGSAIARASSSERSDFSTQPLRSTPI